MPKPSIDDFEAKGWFLSQEGIDLLSTENPEAKTLEDYITAAKDVRTFSLYLFYRN